MKSKVNKLRSLLRERAKVRLNPSGLGQEVRLESELTRIEKFGWIDYFLMAHELQLSIKKAGGLIGPGRGICASSLVVHLLGLNDVNPCYEQLIQLLCFLADFKRMDAIRCQKVLSMRIAKELEDFHDLFIEGCLSTERFRCGEFTDEVRAKALAERIWDSWQDTSGYLFMKAQAVAEAILLYRIAYLETHSL